MLICSESNAEVGDMCEISSLELPRLRTRFIANKGPDGIVLTSADHAGLFVSPNGLQHPAVRHHLIGIPHAIVLENQFHEHFLMVPNFGVDRVKVLPQCAQREL